MESSIEFNNFSLAVYNKTAPTPRDDRGLPLGLIPELFGISSQERPDWVGLRPIDIDFLHH
jgi:hypothetical protein